MAKCFLALPAQAAGCLLSVTISSYFADRTKQALEDLIILCAEVIPHHVLYLAEQDQITQTASSRHVG